MPPNVQILNSTNTFNAQLVIVTSASTTVFAAQTGSVLITDLLISVNTAMNVTLFAGATTKCTVYLAQQGGFVFPLVTPMIIAVNQPFNVFPSVSGSCAVYAAGIVLAQ